MKIKKSTLIDIAFISFTALVFILVKLDGLTWRFGDENAYFYMARELLQGQLPYRDFLIADPPLLVFLLAGIKLIIGRQLFLFHWVPILLEGVTAVILYLETKKRLPNFARFVPALYLFSFLILSTSDYVSGLHFVTLFISLAYYWRKKPLLSGFFWGLATLIKLYVIPGFIGWIIWLLISKQLKKIKLMLLAYILTGAVFMLPFLLIAPKNVIDYIIIHQFNRPEGLNKLTVFSFFLVHDFALLILVAAGWIISKNKKYLLPIAGWVVFYLLFKDLYYMYLAVMAPWIILSGVDLLWHLKTSSKIDWLQEQFEPIAYMIITTVFLAQLLGVRSYKKEIQQFGVFAQLPEVAAFIQGLPEKPLHGSHEVAPLVALKTDRQLFGNHIDTNAQLYGSGVMNRKQISQEAAAKGVYLLTKVANIPQNKNLDQGYEGYFDPEVFNESCRRLKIFNGNGADVFDDVAVYECVKN